MFLCSVPGLELVGLASLQSNFQSLPETTVIVHYTSVLPSAWHFFILRKGHGMRTDLDVAHLCFALQKFSTESKNKTAALCSS